MRIVIEWVSYRIKLQLIFSLLLICILILPVRHKIMLLLKVYEGRGPVNFLFATPFIQESPRTEAPNLKSLFLSKALPLRVV